MNDSVLILDIKPGDILHIDNNRILVEMIHKSGQLVRLRFRADHNIDIKKENKCNKDT